MERAAAVVVAGIGLVLLTLAALVFAGPEGRARTGGVELAAFVTAPARSAREADPAVEPSSTASPAIRPTVLPTVPPAAPPTTLPAAPPSSTSSTPSPVGAPSPPPNAAPLAEPQGELVELLSEISAGGIRFAIDRADLDDGARRLLDRLVPLVAGRADLLIVVRGHTDSTGGPDVNAPLSVARAQVVADYLAAAGVPRSRLQVEGLGADVPRADNATEQGRQANRRSEVTTVWRGQ